MMKIPAAWLLSFFCGGIVRHAHSAEMLPWAEPVVSVESGLLWQVGSSTPLSYRLVPTQLSWRSREVLHWQTTHLRLVVRNRLTLFGTWVQQGPESHYIALAASPSVELWNQRGTFSSYANAGGGAGWLDSQGIPGGQGQDFTFNWFARGGVEFVLSHRVRGNVGIMFQHMSNGGQTSPNPGIDALGFTAGCTWSF